MKRGAAADPDALERLVARATGARAVELGERVQALWSGYGEIRRATLSATTTTDVIVKYVTDLKLLGLL